MTNRFNLLQAGSLVPPLAVCQISQTSLVMTDAISLMVRLSKSILISFMAGIEVKGK